MRIPKPYWKKSHKCWYVNLGGKTVKLSADKEEAFKLYADELARSNVKEGRTSPQNVTVRDLLATFLDWTEKHKAAATWQWYRKYIIGTCGKTGKHKDGGFANFVSPRLLVRDLKPYHLENWLDARYPNADDDTKAGAITAILRAFNWAKDQGYIDASPLARVKKPARKGRGEDAYLTPQQWQQVVDRVKSNAKTKEIQPFLDYLTVMRETGCRPQEIRTVEARHLDRANRRWIFAEKESKGKKEKREVLLGDAAFAICCRLADKNSTGPLFRNARGKPWTNFAVACRCKRIAKALGFPVFAYSVRHTFGTEAIINGADVITVARLMGHRDLTMLNKVYQHVTQDREHMEAARKKATDRLPEAS